ncbi:MAG: peptide deformylase [Solirubrobacterales bacterium]|nr:peptide deformylase [Solirubrobacterales bacterium]
MADVGKTAETDELEQELDPDEMIEEAEPVEGPPDREIDEERMRRREAALARIVQFGDPVLKSKASAISEFNGALADEIESMAELMNEALGVGLAAPQVGKLRRLLVFQSNPDVEPRELINPEIEWLSDEADIAIEGCLSIPRVLVEVERPVFARVRGQDRRGAEVVLEASGFEARVLQHEIDHLNGILILDRTERPQRRAALKALRRGESFSPIDPDGDGDSEADGE